MFIYTPVLIAVIIFLLIVIGLLIWVILVIRVERDMWFADSQSWQDNYWHIRHQVSDMNIKISFSVDDKGL